MQQTISRYIPILAVLLIAFLFIQTLTSLKAYRYIGGDNVPSNVITVSGVGEVFASADVATFSFGVEATASTVEAAQAQVTEGMSSSLEVLKQFGIEERDIKTQNYQVFPQYEYGNGVCNEFRCGPTGQTLTGYRASQSVFVKVRDLAEAGSIVGALGEAGATNISGLSFTIDDEDELKREARQMAIAEAKEKAKVLADDLGVRLVGIVSFSENEWGTPMPFYAKAESFDSSMAQGSAAPQLPSGENTVTSQVNIVYEIR